MSAIADPARPTSTAGTWPEEVVAVLERMARREVAGHFLVPADQPPGVIRPPSPPVTVAVRRCPWCGRDGGDDSFADLAVPFSHWRIRPAAEPLAEAAEVGAAGVGAAGTDVPVLTMLGCEWLTPRAVLPMAAAIERYGPALVPAFQTRAAARAGLVAGLDDLTVLPILDRAEEWADALVAEAAPEEFTALAGEVLPGGLVLPAATRSLTSEAGWPAVRAALEPLFAGPHYAPAGSDRLAERYVAVRLRHAGQALDGELPCPA